jgi:hypothetical protein
MFSIGLQASVTAEKHVAGTSKIPEFTYSTGIYRVIKSLCIPDDYNTESYK